MSLHRIKFRKLAGVTNKEALEIKEAFNTHFYLTSNLDLNENQKSNPVEHYCKVGWKEGRDPTPGFSTNAYLQLNPDVAEANINPFWHFLKYGINEGRSMPTSELSNVQVASNSSNLETDISTIIGSFDTEYYLKHNEDLRGKKRIELLKHYCLFGWKEGRNPSSNFSTSYYLESNPDVRASGINPLVHFVKYGSKEGRLPSVKHAKSNVKNLNTHPKAIPWREKRVSPTNLQEIVKLVFGDIDEESIGDLSNKLEIYRQKCRQIKCKKIVYTAHFGDYDLIQPISDKSDDVAFVCLTDNPNLEAAGYEIICVPPLFLDMTRSARVLKSLPHIIFRNAKYSLWIDSSTKIRDPRNVFQSLLHEIGNNDVLLHRHSQRICVYKEGDACKALNKDDSFIIDSFLASLNDCSYPENRGLFETAQVFRKHNRSTALFNERWWEIMREFSRRDQLSFPFVEWRMPIKIREMDGTQWIDRHFKNFLHKAAAIDVETTDRYSTSIIMLVHNKPEISERAIHSLLNKTKNQSYHLHIVDNASDKPTKNMLREYEKKSDKITVHRNKNNLSFSEANNCAVNLSQSDFICFINNDTEIVDEFWLDRLIKAFISDPLMGAAGPILLFPDYSIQSAGIDIHTDNNTMRVPAAENTKFHQSRSKDALTGACLLVKRELHQKIGGFDERFWYGQEDIDYCLRIREAGYNLNLVVESEVIHHESQTRSFNFRSSRNRGILSDKWRSRFSIIDKTAYFRKQKPSFSEVLTMSRLRFRGYEDVVRVIKNNIHNLPIEPDLIVGIPRSGLFAAAHIASMLNLDMISFDQFVSGTKVSGADRPRNQPKYEDKIRVLIVDDSINAGRAYRRALDLVPKSFQGKKVEYRFLAVFGSENWYDETSVTVLERCLLPRIFQWNYLNHGISQFACFDLDGVLCQDPRPEQNDDGKKYIEFIKTAAPKTIPRYPIEAIVTSRLEKYRAETEEWLSNNHVNYNKLIMLDIPTAEERRKLKAHAPFKSKIYSELGNTFLFVESEPHQAKEIFGSTKKPVICTANDEFYT